MKLLVNFESRSAFFWLIIGYLLLIGAGVVDIITGNELAFSLFYLIPVMLVTWFLGRNQGLIICLVAASIWYFASIVDGQVYSQPAISHQTGDDVLCKFVARTKSHLRKTDIMARLGGDEFILLLSETDQDTAQVSIPRVQSALLDEMKQHQWSVTFSIGVLTYQSGEISADELINKADDLMYSVKKSGKNSITYAVYSQLVAQMKR